jgi:hypothetical protein
MHKIFTPEDLVRFAYHEMSKVESRELQEELQSCHELRCEFEEIMDSKSMMSFPKTSASSETINSILNYSKSLRILEPSSTGKSFEVILN